MAETLTAPARSARLIGLDLLRLLAVVFVMGRHMEPAPDTLPLPVKSVLDAWLMYGGFGVDLFFVLSGFLVSGLLFTEYRKHNSLSISRFYLRRAWKIYPAFYFLIGVTYFYCWWVLGHKLPDRPVYSELLFIQCYQSGHWNHTWTLAVEEHFYLVLPIVLLIFARRNRGAIDPFRPVMYLVATISMLCLTARALNWWVRPEVVPLTHVFPTHLRVDSLFFGVALAYAYHFHSERFHKLAAPRRFALIGVGLTLVSLAAISTNSEAIYYTFGFTLLYLGFAAVLVGVLMCQIPVNRATRTLAAVGTFSYSIYLWHMAAMYYLIPQMREAGYSWQTRFAVYFASAFVVGIVMAKLIELPTLRLRDRLFPSRSDLPTSQPTALPQAAPAARQAA